MTVGFDRHESGGRVDAGGPRRVLLLAGSGEARAVAAGLAAMPQVEAVASLARPERVARELGVPLRIGGFGGDAGFETWLRQRRIGAVVDATHPFAARISRRSARICADLGIDYLQVLRPPWRPGKGDRWIEVDDLAQAIARIPDGARVFVATGRGWLDPTVATGRREILVRRLSATGARFPYARGGFRVDLPPFSVEGEEALLRRLGVAWLVVHNAGGAGGWPKIEAARRLGLPVAMIRRPAQPDAAQVETPREALAWVRQLA